MQDILAFSKSVRLIKTALLSHGLVYTSILYSGDEQKVPTSVQENITHQITKHHGSK